MKLPPWCCVPGSLVIAWTLLATGGLARGEDPRPGQAPPPASTPPAPAFQVDDGVMRALMESWPDRPEWLDMYTDILRGSQLGPNDGWFRRAIGQTRFTWEAARNCFDRNDDGAISLEEFAGPATDFERLDRDHDRLLTAADFDFSPHALTMNPGALLFLRADRDGNGKVTPEEWEGVFRQVDSGSQGFLCLSDLQDALRTSPPKPASSAEPRTPAGPSKETLIRGLFRQEIGSLQPGPSLGEKAPDFTLKTSDGREEITLSKQVGPKPVVLVFGNVTCGPFRSQAGNVEKLYQRYKDRATFVMVYVREAHPTDGWQMESNQRVGVALPQPTTYDERVSVAQACGKRLGLGFPVLVDSIDDAVGAHYSGMPSRLYLIDRDGTVAYKSGRGPFGFKPSELEHSLILLLRDQAATETPRGSARPEVPSGR